LSERWLLRRQECGEAADRLRPVFDRYGLKLGDAFPGGEGECIADFDNPELAGRIDCEDICNSYAIMENEGDLENCVRDCEEQVRFSTRGSISFNPKTERVRESSLTIDCSNVFSTEDFWEEEEEEDNLAPYRELKARLEAAGCEVVGEPYEWVHQHEFVRDWIGGYEPDEILPAVCYLHVKRCRVEDLLRTVYGRGGG
jgi:hypothetical protein